MADKNINAYCEICNGGYYVCRSCLEQRTLKPWRTVTDTIEHYKIYLAIHGYTISKDKAKAKAELKNCDLSGLGSFKPEIKAVIKEIMTEPKKTRVSTKKEKENIKVETEIKTDDVDE